MEPWEDNINILRAPFIQFLTLDSFNYKKYSKLGFVGTKKEYKKFATEIHEVLKKFNYKMFLIRKNPLFNISDFYHISILIKDIYKYGSSNWPCFRIHTHPAICAHPGKHLWIAKKFLNLPDTGFLSCRKKSSFEKKYCKKIF